MPLALLARFYDRSQYAEVQETIGRLEQNLDKLDSRFGQFDTKLDAHFVKLDDLLRGVEIAELEGRVTSLPATWAIIVIRFAEVGFLFGLVEVSGPP